MPAWIRPAPLGAPPSTGLPRRLGLASLTGLLGLSGLLAGCGGGSHPEPVFQPSVVVAWNTLVLEAVRLAPPRPTVNSRALYIVHAAMYEAWVAYDPVARGPVLGERLRRPADERTEANKQAAVSYAALATLRVLYADHERQTGAFTAQMARLGLATDAATLASRDPATAAGLGQLAAEAVLAARAADGANQAGGYAEQTSATYPQAYAPRNRADPATGATPGGPLFDPNRWQPLRVPTGQVRDPQTGLPVVVDGNPASYKDQAFLTPHWGAVTPFALGTGGALRPPPPPRLGSTAPYTDALGITSSEDEAYRRQVDEIVRLTAGLTERHKAIADYWADGPDSVTPPGHWNEFAADLSYKYRYSIDADVKLFFALNGALMDSSIACWEAKRQHDFIRPVSAVRHLYDGQSLPVWPGPGQAVQALDGSRWQPFQAPTFLTPGFPEYTSGHSTFSAAAAEVLQAFTGSARLYDGVTRLPRDRNGDGHPDRLGEAVIPAGSLKTEPGLPTHDLVLRWNTLQEAADEAGLSRRYGGIHFQDGDLQGRRMGREIGRLAFERASRHWRGLQP